MAQKLDDEQKEEFTEAFNEFAKKAGRVGPKDLQALMRHMGTIQTDAETLEMVREAGGNEQTGIDLGQYLNWMGNKMTENHTADDLVLAFSAFDKDGNGQISTSELRYVLCCLGDKLDDEAVDTMLEQADRAGSGAVQYESFVRNMLSR
eukprot:TRINITY_DN2169_c0_g1_i2.p1 TRINITY_DN2169_c0_g1~~TRINITY_DN2169_c0_g1_i2.p1  ORF type:complete len:149 (+),score=34.18 TRINITY_DN2169_c0_g1_i2:158-604(+)